MKPKCLGECGHDVGGVEGQAARQRYQGRFLSQNLLILCSVMLTMLKVKRARINLGNFGTVGTNFNNGVNLESVHCNITMSNSRLTTHNNFSPAPAAPLSVVSSRTPGSATIALSIARRLEGVHNLESQQTIPSEPRPLIFLLEVSENLFSGLPPLCTLQVCLYPGFPHVFSSPALES